MKAVHWTGLALLLGVGAVFFWLRLQVPLLVPLFGLSLPVEGLWLLGFGLGVLFAGLYLLAFGLSAFWERRRLMREIGRLKGELEAIRRERIEEIPRIPDRDQETP